MKNIAERRRFLQRLGAGTLALAGTRHALGQSSATSNSAQKKIVMVTWRGITEVEKGFNDYCQSNNIKADFIWLDAEQSQSRLASFSEEIVRLRADLVYTWGTPATVGIAGSIDKPHPVIGNRIPLVFALVADAVAGRIVSRLSDHGRNISGVSHVAPVAAHLQAMQTYRPIKGVGILYNRLEPNAVNSVAAWQRLSKLNVVTAHFPLNERGQLLPPNADANRRLVEKIAKAGANWLYLGPDSHLFTQLDSVASAALDVGLLTFASVESMLNSSAPVLSGLVSPFYDVGQFAARKAELMLAGQTPVPIETLKRFSYIVRLDTAKRISAYPPLGLIEYAQFRR
jgi:putative tryptophan/tyrosine transport system substrate-binding protein